ncbi:hypothetical protein SAMN06265367_11238 [Algoriphagus winogradskyi]|uniref:HPt domain-containing protein n=2 Tax=Algoriphagus winogradskyi TaxID=237017 RepID=A0ABY1PKD1_9BACT|nr:hypothetical protein SAMN06265367_11238 [Algoriphagus winogradskyi]
METPSLTYLKDLSKGNKNFEMKIFKILLDELPAEYETYQHAIKTQNYYWAADIVHKIKHKVAFFQMKEALSITEKHETALIAGNTNYQLEFQEVLSNILTFLPEQYE